MASTSIPKHVQNKLVTDGVMTRDRITRKPQKRACPRCGRLAWAVIDLVGFEVWFDPGWLDPLAELTVLSHGGDTYRVEPGDTVIWRAHWDIRDQPADETVHPRHHCAKIWPVKQLPPKPVKQIPEEPPF